MWLCLLGKTQQRCPIFALHEAMGAHRAMPGIAQALLPGFFVFLCQAQRCTLELGEWVLGACRGNWELLGEKARKRQKQHGGLMQAEKNQCGATETHRQSGGART